MSGQFFRAPGAKVTYTPKQTRNYVSRKVRLSRGLNMTPTRRDRKGDGWLFWFRSPRGPRQDGGNWKVDVVRFDADGGGSGGGPGWNCSNGECSYSSTAGVYSTQTACEQARIPVYEPPIFAGGQGAASYDVTVFLSNSTSRYRRLRGPIGGFRVTNGSDGLIRRVQGLAAGINNGTGCTTFEQFNGVQDWRSFVGEVPLGVSISSVSVVHVSTCSGADSTENPPDILVGYDCGTPSGGGGPPPGFLPAEGPWAYKCNCPDYSGDEPAYNVPLAPSHRKARAFALARPLSPCKHIASAAQALHDQKTLLKWTQQYAGDSPGREYTEGPRITYDDSLNRATQAAENAFRKTQRDANKVFRQKQAQERAARSARRLSERIGRMNRWSVVGGRAQIASSSNVGRFGEPLNLDVASRDIRNRWAAEPYQEQYLRDLARYNNRPDVRLGNTLNNRIRTPVGNLLNRIPAPPASQFLAESREYYSQRGNRPTDHFFQTKVGRDVTERIYGEGMTRVGTFDPRLYPTITIKGPSGAPTAGSVGPSINQNSEAYGF